ncbi:sulfatase [Micromonospora sp. ATA51]|nr:sulfatase [Micromonospora sp. ATA51]MBM0224890.1 sulfatase [Micromonospora sp. ATA51]
MTSGASNGRPRRPDIVMILTDDHAAHAVGAYGSAVNRTPRIDEIGEHGVRFENCFVTNSLCSPSRATILTGTYSHVNGVKTLVTPIDAAQPTFVSQLRDAGYRTAIVGKWHLGDGAGHDPQNFDYWDVLIEQGEYFDPRFLSAEGLRTERGYATDVITDLSLRWLDSLDGDDPWCVLICHKAPHRSWEPDEAHAGMYAGHIPVPVTFADDYATRTSSARRAAMRIADHLTLEDLKQPVPDGMSYEEQARWKYQRYMEDYLACVASVDDNVGRVIDWLRQRGRFDDTVLIYSSDQGFFLGEHGWFDKRFMYEESLRMPLLLSCPRAVAGGQVHDGIVTNVDFAQSILDAPACRTTSGCRAAVSGPT